MKDEKSKYLYLIRELPFWEHLSKQQQDLMLKSSKMVYYKAGESIYASDDDCLGAVFVQKGIIRAYLLSEDGKEATIYRVREHEPCVLSASCILSSITFDVQIGAETDCSILLIPAAIFSSIMKENIFMENFVYKLTAEKFSKVVEAMERMFFMNLIQRIAVFLLDESSKINNDTVYITQENLARNIGSAREAVSRNMKQMVKEGSIEIYRGGIKILDKGLLYNTLSMKS